MAILYVIYKTLKKILNKPLILIVIILASLSTYAQTKLFDDFTYMMTKKEAYSLLKNNKKKFTSFLLGPSNFFTLRKGSLIFEKDDLIHITIWSKSNLNLKKTKQMLNTSINHLKSQGFELVYAQPDWENPLSKLKNRPYIRLIHKKNKIMVEVEPRGRAEAYNIFLSYYDLDWFREKLVGL